MKQIGMAGLLMVIALLLAISAAVAQDLPTGTPFVTSIPTPNDIWIPPLNTSWQWQLTGTGFPLSYQDQINYNRFLANEANARGLSIGLKNDMDQIKDLLAYFDWALNEQCFQFRECRKLMPFINAGKAVFQVEYYLPRFLFCPSANRRNFNSMRKHLNLDAWRSPCR